MAKQGQTRNLSRLVDLFTSGLLAGLGEKLNSFLQFLDQDIQQFGGFADVAIALRKLYFISVSTSPIGATKHLDIASVIQSAYSRLVYLCDDLPQVPEDNVDECLDALKLTAELLRSIDTDILDPQLFDEAIDRVVEQNPPPVILGAVLAICFQAGRRDIATLTDALQGYFQGSVTEEQRIGILKGILHTAPTLLLWEEQLIICIDNFLAELSEESFITLLPHIRLAFTALNPAETDKIAETIAKLHGFNAGSLSSVVLSFDDESRQQGHQINQALIAALEADGILADYKREGVSHE